MTPWAPRAIRIRPRASNEICRPMRCRLPASAPPFRASVSLPSPVAWAVRRTPPGLRSPAGEGGALPFAYGRKVGEGDRRPDRAMVGALFRRHGGVVHPDAGRDQQVVDLGD